VSSGPGATSPHPLLHAMLVCDVTIRDAATGKVSLVGIFETIQAFTFPVVHPALCVYVNLTDLLGQYTMRLDLTRIDDDVSQRLGEMTVTFTDPMQPAEVIFDLRDLVFERPGRYEFRLSANGRYVGGKPFTVVRAVASPPAAPSGPAA
jgi:hypothetical protein